MFATDPPPGKKAWRIELSHLDEPSRPKRFVLLKHRALATSGDTFQFIELNGKRYSHIVDPKTGIGLTDHSLVNVVAKDCMTADALSKLVSVLPPHEALRIIERTPAVAARIVRKPHDKVEEYETQNWKAFVE